MPFELMRLRQPIVNRLVPLGRKHIIKNLLLGEAGPTLIEIVQTISDYRSRDAFFINFPVALEGGNSAFVVVMAPVQPDGVSDNQGLGYILDWTQALTGSPNTLFVYRKPDVDDDIVRSIFVDFQSSGAQLAYVGLLDAKGIANEGPAVTAFNAQGATTAPTVSAVSVAEFSLGIGVSSYGALRTTTVDAEWERVGGSGGNDPKQGACFYRENLGPAAEAIGFLNAIDASDAAGSALLTYKNAEAT